MTLNEVKRENLNINSTVRSLNTGNIGKIVNVYNNVEQGWKRGEKGEIIGFIKEVPGPAKCLTHDEWHSFIIEIQWITNSRPQNSIHANCDYDGVELIEI